MTAPRTLIGENEIITTLQAEIARLTAERDAALAGRVKLAASRIPSTFYPIDRTGYETEEAMNAAHDAIAEDALRSYPGAGGDQVKALCMLARGLQSVIEGAKSRQVAAFTAAIQPDTERAEPVAVETVTGDRSDIDRLVSILRGCRHGSDISHKAADWIELLAHSEFEAVLALKSTAPPSQPITAQDAARVLLAHGPNGERRHIYDACEGRCRVYKFDAVLRAIAEQGGR